MVQTGMAAPYGGGVFPPPVNGVAGVVGAAGAAGEVKAPPPVTVKEDNSGAGQQAPPSGAQVPAATSAGPHPSAAGAQTAASFSPPPPPNGVDQQIVSIPFFALSEKNHRGHSNDFLPRSSRRVAFGRVPRTNNDFSSVRGAWGRVFLRRTFIDSTPSNRKGTSFRYATSLSFSFALFLARTRRDLALWERVPDSAAFIL